MPATAIFAIWAAGLEQFIGLFEARVNKGEDQLDAAINTIRDVSKESRNIRFEGDAYTRDWQQEAARRGIIKAHTIPEGIDLLLEPETVKMLERLGVFSRREIETFHTIKLESFVKNIEIEMAVLRDMVWEGILPGISRQLLLEHDSFAVCEGLKVKDAKIWQTHLAKLAGFKIQLMEKAQELVELKEHMATLETRQHAEAIVTRAVPLMDEIRRTADSAELYMSSDNMPYPNYRSLLSLSA